MTASQPKLRELSQRRRESRASVLRWEFRGSHRLARPPGSGRAPRPPGTSDKLTMLSTEDSLVTPGGVVGVDGAVVGEVVREVFPGDSGAVDVEECVEYVAQVDLGRWACGRAGPFSRPSTSARSGPIGRRTGRWGTVQESEEASAGNGSAEEFRVASRLMV